MKEMEVLVGHLIFLPPTCFICLFASLPPNADHMKEMKVSLEHLIFLPPNSALALLLAVWPICRRAAQSHKLLGLWAKVAADAFRPLCVWSTAEKQQHTLLTGWQPASKRLGLLTNAAGTAPAYLLVSCPFQLSVCRPSPAGLSGTLRTISSCCCVRQCSGERMPSFSSVCRCAHAVPTSRTADCRSMAGAVQMQGTAVPLPACWQPAASCT